MKCKWLVDQYMVDHNEQDVVGILRAEGFEVHVRSFSRTERVPPLSPFAPNDCVVLYGSLQFVAKHRALPIVPGAYWQDKAMQHTTYSNVIPSHLLLNEEHVLATLGDVRRRFGFYTKALGSDGVFIRPNSGNKVFAGSVVRSVDELSALQKTFASADDTVVVVAPLQSILAEYRLMVVNGEVITGSQYQKNGEVHLDRRVPTDVWNVARQVADLSNAIDVAYVCDVASTPKGPKVVELNALSTSGWYLADIPALAHAVSAAAVLEWGGELSIGDIKKVTL